MTDLTLPLNLCDTFWKRLKSGWYRWDQKSCPWHNIVFIASQTHWSLSVIDLSICYLSLYPSVCRRKKTSIHITEAAQTRDHPHLKSFKVLHFCVFFYKCQSLSVSILDFGLWWRIWLQDDGSFFYGF